jgi:hypothetical protein
MDFINKIMRKDKMDDWREERIGICSCRKPLNDGHSMLSMATPQLISERH